MKRKNLYFAQLGEAISLANKNIFEYKRISLILFDNLIENLLKSQCYEHLSHNLHNSKITKEQFESKIDGFNRFENILIQSKKLSIIQAMEKPILDFCHKTRNNLFHNLFDDERVTEFCIIYCCVFLGKRFENLMEIGTISNSLLKEISALTILTEEKVEELNEIIPKLNRVVKSHRFSPQIILSHILSDYISMFESFFESTAHESWVEFNQMIKNQYFFSYEVKRKKNSGIELNEIIPKFKLQWFDLNEKKMSQIKEQINQLKTFEIEKAFEKFDCLNTFLEPIYIGIMLYNSDQEYIACAQED